MLWYIELKVIPAIKEVLIRQVYLSSNPLFLDSNISLSDIIEFIPNKQITLISGRVSATPFISL